MAWKNGMGRAGAVANTNIILATATIISTITIAIPCTRTTTTFKVNVMFTATENARGFMDTTDEKKAA